MSSLTAYLTKIFIVNFQTVSPSLKNISSYFGPYTDYAERYGYNSAEVVWRPDAAIEIALAPRARGGNWIPTGGRDRLVAILRLYDAPIGFGSRSGDNADLPAIRQEFCQ